MTLLFYFLSSVTSTLIIFDLSNVYNAGIPIYLTCPLLTIIFSLYLFLSFFQKVSHVAQSGHVLRLYHTTLHSVCWYWGQNPGFRACCADTVPTKVYTCHFYFFIYKILALGFQIMTILGIFIVSVMKGIGLKNSFVVLIFILQIASCDRNICLNMFFYYLEILWYLVLQDCICTN